MYNNSSAKTIDASALVILTIKDQKFELTQAEATELHHKLSHILNLGYHYIQYPYTQPLPQIPSWPTTICGTGLTGVPINQPTTV